jgi:MFS family permease
VKGKRAYAGRRPEGIVAALSRYFHRLLRLFADDHAVRPHADGDKRLSRRGRDDGPAERGARYPSGIAVAAYVLISLGIELGSLALIAIGCLIGGLAESNIAIAQSAISDVAGPDERPRLFAWIYSCCSLGYIAGPVIGGQLPMICVTLPDLISANTILDEGSSIIMAGEIAGLKVDEEGLLGVERAQRLVSPCQPMTRA